MSTASDRVEAVLFDIDGTLIDSGGAGAESWRRAFDELYAIPADIGEYTDNGMTDPEVGRLTFTRVVGHAPSDEEMSRLMTTRASYLEVTVAESQGYRVLPGVKEVLARLRDKGLLLGLTTGGTEEAGRIKLERGGLNEYFAFGGYGSDSEDRAELTRCAVERASERLGHALTPDQVMVVGDTVHDIAAALAAGATPVGVASGHYTEEQLRGAGGEIVLGSLKEPLPV
jgi:phosphoglycolate phosphatase-like HAD superfamily hydrolase